MAHRDRVVAIGLLTQRDLDMLGHGFHRAYPVNSNTDFSELLAAIDEAEQRMVTSGPEQDR